MMNKEFENVLEYVGSCGRYQKTQIFLFLVPSCILVFFRLGVFYFQTVIPDHWCKVEGRDKDAHSIEEWRSFTIPKNERGEYEQCIRYVTTWNEQSNVFFVFNRTTGCDGAWEHDSSDWKETFATDEHLFCEKEHLNRLVSFVFAGGCSAVAMVLPIFVDRIHGRQRMFLILVFFHVLFDLVLLTPIQLHGYFTFWFFTGATLLPIAQIPFIMTMEMVNQERRALVAVISAMSCVVGLSLAPLVTFLIPHWWYLVIVSGAPIILLLVSKIIVYQSPRWLLSMDSIKECSQVMLQVALCNKNDNYVQMETLKKNLRHLLELEMRNLRICDVIKHRRLSSYFIYLFIISFLLFTSYGFIFVRLDLKKENSFLNFFLLVILDIPGIFIGWFSVNYAGRRLSFVCASLLVGSFCLVNIIFLENELVVICCSAIIKTICAEAILVLLLLTAEMFPTPLRAAGMGCVTVAAVAGLVTAAIGVKVLDLLWMFTAIAIGNVVLLVFSTLLPETLGLNLPQTLLDAEDLGRDRPFNTFIHYWNLEDWLKENLRIT